MTDDRTFLSRWINPIGGECISKWDGLDLTGHNTDLKYLARDCRSKCLAK